MPTGNACNPDVQRLDRTVCPCGCERMCIDRDCPRVCRGWTCHVAKFIGVRLHTADAAHSCHLGSSPAAAVHPIGEIACIRETFALLPNTAHDCRLSGQRSTRHHRLSVIVLHADDEIRMIGTGYVCLTDGTATWGRRPTQ